MATDTLEQFVEERLLAYDPDIDLTEGSPAKQQVVDPIVQRFMPDPFEMSIEDFITAQLQQQFPESNFGEGTGIRDLLAKPARVLLDPIQREVQLVRRSQSLSNPELLAPAEADALVANLFITRATGGMSTGTVRLYFTAPIAINVGSSTIAYTADGLRYVPTAIQSITAEAMIFNQSGNLYYFDAQFAAESPGENYNVPAGSIVGITNLNTAVRVTNLASFEGGLDEESTDDLVTRAEASITERSLVTLQGVQARLRTVFEDLKHLQVIGYSDEEMQRDIITGGDLGPAVASGNDGYTEDDGNGDAYTYNFRSQYTNFLTTLGAVGPINNYYLAVTPTYSGTAAEVPAVNRSYLDIDDLTFVSSDLNLYIQTYGADPENTGLARIIGVVSDHRVKLDRVGVTCETPPLITWVFSRPAQIVEIDSVVDANELRLKSPLPVDIPIAVWTIHQKVLELSDIPGGIVSTVAQAALQVPSDQIHVGGCTDFYVRGVSTTEDELVLTAITDEEPLVKALTLETDVADDEFVVDPTKDFLALGVKIGYSIIIETGSSAGTRTIVRVGVDPSGSADPTYLQVSPAITATEVDLRYRIVDNIDIDLVTPKTVRGDGTDLQTIQGSSQVTTASALDFLAIGVEAEDVLEIFAGPNKSTYTVRSITGVGNRNLVVDGTMKSTANNLEWQVYQPHTGITRPLVRVRNLDLLDSSSQPTGDKIPYANPVDARATAFSNAGRGVKVSIRDGITGIVGTKDLSTAFPVPAATVIGISVNGATTVAVDVSGATDISDLLDTLNAVVPNMAGTITYDGITYLTLRSRDRWLRVMPQGGPYTNYANLGLNVLGEDNRQIRSVDTVADWSSASYDLRAEEDVISITTGDNIGLHYFIAVGSPATRIYGLAFDETAGETRFLQPNVGVSLTVGSRSYGKARVYFLDPTSFEVRGAWRPPLKNTTSWPANKAYTLAGSTIATDETAATYFTATVDGYDLRFFPDPELKQQILPSVEEDIPNNLLTVNGDPVVYSQQTLADPLGQNSRSADQNFIGREILPGDLLEVTYQPIQGDEDLELLSYPAALVGKTLTISIDGAIAKTLTFSDQLTDSDSVVGEINNYFGSTIAYLEDISGESYLRFETDYDLLVYGTGTANTVLGLPVTATRNSAVAHIDGYYTVSYVGGVADPTESNSLTVTPTPTDDGQAQHFKLYRPGVQRIHSTAMNGQLESGLYYVDIELVSEGTGDQYNLTANTAFLVTGYSSDGYRLEVLDSDLSYSTEEQVHMVLSRRMLTLGTSDRPDEATLLHNQNIQINYDRSPITESIQSFASSVMERVLNASILVRHLQPHYINFTMTYRGGSTADIVKADILELLDNLGPDERVEVSDIQNVARIRGADYVVNPMELVAIAHDEERVIAVDRSEDYVSKGRLATFIPNTITVTQES